MNSVVLTIYPSWSGSSEGCGDIIKKRYKECTCVIYVLFFLDILKNIGLKRRRACKVMVVAAEAEAANRCIISIM